MSKYKSCLNCGTEYIAKRETKKFCSSKCRSASHMKKKRDKEKVYLSIEKILRKNHQILESLLEEERDITYPDLKYYGFNYIFYTAKRALEGKSIILYYNIGIIINDDKTIKIIDTNELR